MSKKKKILCIFGIIILNIILLIAYLVVRDLRQERLLKEEVKVLTELDITKDRYNRKLKTSGDYRVVEKTIKKYLDDYAKNTQKLMILLDDKEISQLLSAENYQKDGPNFVESLAYIQNTKDEFNQGIDYLIEKCDEDEIMKSIETKNLDTYYIDLYQELMFDEGVKKDLDASQEVLNNAKKDMNNLFDVASEVLNFLSLNQGSWKVENNQILFQTNDLVAQYNNLISKLK